LGINLPISAQAEAANLTEEQTAAAEGNTVQTEQSQSEPTLSSSTNGADGEEDERHSAGESIDSSELSNRFSVLVPASSAEDENTRDGTEQQLEQTEIDPATPLALSSEQQQAEHQESPTLQPESAAVTGMEVDQQEPAAVTSESGQQAAVVQEEGATSNTVEQQQPAERADAEPDGADEDYRAILGNIEIPDGVDPAFLAALPDDIRQEVIRDHMRQQRAQRIGRFHPIWITK